MSVLLNENYYIGIPCDREEHVYRLQGGPIDDPLRAQAAMAAFGLAITSWARMEQHIDAILIQINRINHSSPKLDLFDPNHPKPFTDKLKMLKRYFRKHPALETYREKIIDAAEGLKKLSNDRNEFSHAIFEEFDDDMVTLNSIKYNRSSNDFLCRKRIFPLAMLDEFTRITNLTNETLSEVSKELFTVNAVLKLRTHEPPARRWWMTLRGRLFH